MKGTCHERIIIRCITEYYQLCTAQGIIFLGILCSLPDHLTHQLYGIHVDTGLGGAQVHRAAHTLCGRQRQRNGTDQQFVRRGHSLADQCGITAQEVHTNLMCYLIQCLCNTCKVFYRMTCRTTDQCNGSYGNSLIYNGDAKFSGDLLSGLHQILGCFVDFVINLLI